MTKVMIIEKGHELRDEVQQYLERMGHQVVGAYPTVFEGIGAIEEKISDPNIILINPNLPNVERLVVYIKENYRDIGIIVMLESLTKPKILNLLINGCDNFLFYDHYERKLATAIEDVQQGDSVISGPIVTMIAKHIRSLEHRWEFTLMPKK